MSFTFSYGGGNGTSAETPAAAPSGLIKDSNQDTFMADVIEASREVPVIVDFWADWCGPCKQLTPVLEKAVTAAKGTVRLVKVNVDQNKEIAAQLRVQSLPTVYAFKDGRPVDAFMGAQSASQIKTFIEKITGSAVGPSDEELLIDGGQKALEAEDFEAAAQAFSAVLQRDAENLPAIAGLTRALMGAGDLDGAQNALALVPAGKENDTEISSARAALELAATPVDSEEISALSAKIEANEKDHQSRIDLAIALNAAGRFDEAMEHLITSIRQDRAWNEEAARKQLLQFFEAWGHADERTVAGRRMLSSVLFS